VHQPPPLRGLEVDDEAALVAVEVAEETDPEAGQTPGGVTLGRQFDFHDLGFEIGEHEARRRSHHGVAELQHAQAREL
jgi:hypothetical protein